MATITHPTGNGYCRDRILRDTPRGGDGNERSNHHNSGFVGTAIAELPPTDLWLYRPLEDEMAECFHKMIVVAIMLSIYTASATTKEDVNSSEGDNSTTSRSTSFGRWSSIECYYVYNSTKLIGRYNCCGGCYWIQYSPGCLASTLKVTPVLNMYSLSELGYLLSVLVEVVYMS